jgi:hypothetical protein
VVELLRLRSVKVDDDGRLHVIQRQVLHVREGDGGSASFAIFAQSYGRKLKRMHGWRVDARGECRSFDEVITTQLFEGPLYTEAKKILLAIPNVGPETIVAFEEESEAETEGIEGDAFAAGEGWPVLEWTYELHLPDGWTAQGFWSDSLEAVSSWPPAEQAGTRWVWSFSELRAPAEDEPQGLPRGRRIPAFTLRWSRPDAPPEGRWADVARWYAPFSESSWSGDEAASAIDEAAQRIVPAGAVGEAPMRAVSDYVRERIGYVQIYLGDGGYRPHPAAEVLKNGYGDCKDMAHLAVALLRSGGVHAWPVLTRSEEPQASRPLLPSPGAFNHCIVAVENGNGGLSFFDPTAKQVPLGRLPGPLEGGFGLVVGSPWDSALVTLPGVGARENARERLIDCDYEPARGLRAHVREVRRGQPAFSLRSELLAMAAHERKRLLSDELRAGAPPGLTVEAIELPDLEGTLDTLTIHYDFSMPSPQGAGGGLLVLPPDPLSGEAIASFSEGKRRTPIRIPHPLRRVTEVVWRLPPNCEPVELPPDAEIENRFARYMRQVRLEDGVLRCRREEEIRITDLPASDYELARTWSRAQRSAEQQMILLRAGPR